MIFIINREDIILPLQKIVGVIEKRQTMPILANVLLQAKDNDLFLTGTDLEMQIVACVPIKTEVPGSITVPAKKFLDLCRLLPAKSDIFIELSGTKIKIIANNSRYSLSCIPAELYPEFAQFDVENQFKIKSVQLKKALDKNIFCMANQDVRYYLLGLLLDIINSKFKFVSSDGHRLAIFEDVLNISTGIDARIIIPRKCVLELFKFLDDSATELTIMFSKNYIKIDFDNMIFSAKLIDAKYPDFSKVFDQPYFDPIVIDKQPFKDALTRIAILVNEKFRGVLFEIAEGKIHITTNNPDNDEAEEELAIDYSDNDLAISFNVQYLLEALAHIDSDKVKLTIARNASSCFIDEFTDCEYKFVVMPRRN